MLTLPPTLILMLYNPWRAASYGRPAPALRYSTLNRCSTATLLTRLYNARSAVLLILGFSSQKMKGLRKLKLEKSRLTEKSTAGGG